MGCSIKLLLIALFKVETGLRYLDHGIRQTGSCLEFHVHTIVSHSWLHSFHTKKTETSIINISQ